MSVKPGETERTQEIQPGPPVQDKLTSEPAEVSTRLFWDVSTAYDLFISLAVLHMPEKYGLRASWAAGVRSRLTVQERKTLLLSIRLIKFPFSWVQQLSEPRDAETVLWELRRLAPEKRLFTLVDSPDLPLEIREGISEITARGAWSDSDIENVRSVFRKQRWDVPRPKEMADMLDQWAHPAEFGERYLDALQSYHQAFFAEEQLHILPVLQRAAAHAQEMASRLHLSDLIEQLSQGVHIEGELDRPELVLAPSYWLTPYIVYANLTEVRDLVVFGARPPDVSVVPGEPVPDALLLSLKALGDPTRLRILRYLAHERLTPAELSRRLRLRAPTVLHHLGALRLAGLVHVTYGPGAKEARYYTARLESLETLFANLDEFFVSDQDDEG